MIEEVVFALTVLLRDLNRTVVAMYMWTSCIL